MAAFFLFVLAVAGGVVVADLVWENTTAGQITVFHHTVSGYPEGWLLAIAAGLGSVVALLLVATVKRDGNTLAAGLVKDHPGDHEDERYSI